MIEMTYQQKLALSSKYEIEIFSEKLRGTSVLFIEDEYVNLMYFSELLSETGIRFYTAYSLSKALDLLYQFKTISLVVVSSSLAEQTDFDILAKLKGLYPNLPIITIIMNNNFRIEKAYLESKSDLYISRYTDKNNLMEAIVDLLNQNHRTI